MSADFNQDHFYTKNWKKIMLGLGVFVTLCLAYITHLYFEYRVVNAVWETTFVSPTEFWEEVPDWEWTLVFTNK